MNSNDQAVNFNDKAALDRIFLMVVVVKESS